MAKITFLGLVPPDDPMFLNTYQIFSPQGSKQLIGSSQANTTSKLMKASKSTSPASARTLSEKPKGA